MEAIKNNWIVKERKVKEKKEPKLEPKDETPKVLAHSGNYQRTLRGVRR